MPCTTILVGKKASADGSTIIARNDDAGGRGHFTPKRCEILHPAELPEIYESVLSHVRIPMPREGAMRCSISPNASTAEKGIWACCGINQANVAITATETITSNPRVLGADPLVEYHPARDGREEIPGGIGEEDIVYLVLPYAESARDGVTRLGQLLETYGTYEMNGIAFSDPDEVWWLETVGGHHWIARRVPDDSYVVMANQLGIDSFDFKDAFGEQKNHMCSADLQEFVRKYHLDLAIDEPFSARDAFGSHDDADHVYNTPRVWALERCFNPTTIRWDGPDADFTPHSDDLPWCLEPEKKITVEDVKYALSNHYQGTPFDCYTTDANAPHKGIFRYTGINRTDILTILQLRPELPEDSRALEWVCYGSNVFNVPEPVYPNTDRMPAYLSMTPAEVSTESFYWTSRLIAALADAAYDSAIFHIERYQLAVLSRTRALLNRYDEALLAEPDAARREELRAKANGEIADAVREEAAATLGLVLIEQSDHMKNTFNRADA